MAMGKRGVTDNRKMTDDGFTALWPDFPLFLRSCIPGVSKLFSQRATLTPPLSPKGQDLAGSNHIYIQHTQGQIQKFSCSKTLKNGLKIT